MTPLDALCEAPFHELSDAARARVLNRLADTEIFVALEAEPVEDRITLRLFDLAEGQMAIASDAEDRLAGFFGAAIAYAAMPGRVLAAMLAEENLTLMVNPGAPSEMLLEPATLRWLAEILSTSLDEEQSGPARLSAPSPAMVAALAEPLASRLADMVGLVESAALVSAEWQDGAEGHLVVIDGAGPDHRSRIAKAVAELIAFLPPLPSACDVAFDLPLPETALILRVEHAAEEPSAPRAPGSDPDKPPILRF
ncbi:SseB family protein [Paracoccus aerodenitrificans]|uniref:SseB family protein n=1 Tax=Paracoccus aerodenitrificans TaxID=3017781 RepID=UPI0022F044DC|nr:SseB family protein [Paracoccus aerodenitrificans]WBU62937.1 SseB family protein [Paracoccus aerodenitrificans]